MSDKKPAPCVIELDSDEESTLTPVQRGTNVNVNHCQEKEKISPGLARMKEEEMLIDLSCPEKLDGDVKDATGGVVGSGGNSPRKKRQRTVFSSVQVLGHTLPYKKSGGPAVLFRNDAMFALIERQLRMTSSVYACKSLAKIFPLTRSDAQSQRFYLENSTNWRRLFVTWKTLQVLLPDAILDQALRDVLNTYTPFEDRAEEEEVSVIDVTAPGSSAAADSGRKKLERDHVKILGVEVPFMVARGKVYLDILGSFTVLGELKLAMRGRWDRVDAILARQTSAGVNMEDAFRRCHRSRNGRARGMVSQRSHIALKALVVLTEHGLVPNRERREMLLRLFSHLQSKLVAVRERKDRLMEQLRIAVDGILSTDSEDSSALSSSEDHKPLSPSTCFKAPHPRSDSCSSSSSQSSSSGAVGGNTTRKSCCSFGPHSLDLAGKAVSYIVQNERIFLKKVEAFSALGRLYVIHCSDYRRADKILEAAGLKLAEHYLFELRSYSLGKARNRRTHVSLEAVLLLVRKGFADVAKNDALNEAADRIDAQLDDLKGACRAGAEEKNTTASAAAVKTEAGVADANTKHILGRAIPFRTEHGKFYLQLEPVRLLLSHEDSQVARLKRRARQLDMRYSFYPAYCKQGVNQYISLECLLKLVEKKHVRPAPALVQQEDDLLVALSNLDASIVKVVHSEPNEPFYKVGAKDDDSDDEYDDDSSDFRMTDSVDGDENGEDSKVDLNEKPTVAFLEKRVPFQVVNDILYLEKKIIFQLIVDHNGCSHRTYKILDRVLEQAKLCLDDAFLYEGRKRSYISTTALKVLLAEEQFLRDAPAKEEILSRLEELEKEKNSLKETNILKMATFGEVVFKSYKNNVFLHTIQILKVVGFSPAYLDTAPSKAYFTVCKLLGQRGRNLASCFLKRGKSKYAYVSLDSIICLFQTDYGPFKDKAKMGVIRTELLDALKARDIQVEEKKPLKRYSDDDVVNGVSGGNSPSSSSRRRVIDIGSGFLPIKYRIKNDCLFLHREACFEAIGLEKSIMTSSRGYTPINDILQRNGVDDIDSCYLAGRREHYSYISVTAVLTLLEAQDPLLMCLEKKEKFTEALLMTLQSSFSEDADEVDTDADADGSSPPTRHLQLDGYDSPIPYRINASERRLFLFRHTAYSLSGLYDKAEHGHYDIFEQPMTPLLDRGVQAHKCFLADGGDPLAFISVDALLILMNLDGDISRANDYHKLVWKNLISAIAMESPKLRVHKKITEFRSKLIKLLLAKFIARLRQSYQRQHKQQASNDGVEVIDLLGDSTEDEAGSSHRPDKKRMRLSTSSIDSISSSVLNGDRRQRYLSTPVFSENMVAEELDPEDAEYLKELLREGIDLETNAGTLNGGDAGGLGTRSPSSASDQSGGSLSDVEAGATPVSASATADPRLATTQDEFNKIRNMVFGSQRNNMIGDWFVQTASQELVCLVVRPGYGASKKMSYIDPDVSAVLQYKLVLRPLAMPQVFINNLAVPGHIVRGIFDKALNEGLLNLLYHFLTLRPCFGSFSPELVETVEKMNAVNSAVATNMYVDNAFIGSSQIGRTYAGTVRSRSCKVLAECRVDDACSECRGLKQLSINRSVLAEDAESADGDDGANQKSVWRIAETSAEGSVFVCPQLQSFNTSLPKQQFSGFQQATSIVEHKVKISHDLRTSIFLNNKPVPQPANNTFDRDKQVASLLDCVASLRFCIGYPDITLVEQASYLTQNKYVLQPEIRKFFDHVWVDQEFRGKLTGGGAGQQLAGTVRAPSCRIVAGKQADLCDQCRLLQEPIEFLGV